MSYWESNIEALKENNKRIYKYRRKGNHYKSFG